MKNWFKMKLLNKDKGEILLYEDIGYFGKTAKDFKAELDELGDVKEIDLRISSDGGNVVMGFTIFNMLLHHPATVQVYIDGMAASMAGVVAMVSNEKPKIAANAFFHTHNPSGGLYGEAKDFRRTADLLDSMKDYALDAYMRHTNLSREDMTEQMDKDTFYTAEEAVAAGFCGEIYGSVEVSASIKERLPEEIKQKLINNKPNNKNTQEETDIMSAELEKENKELKAQLEAQKGLPGVTEFQSMVDEHGYDFAKANFGKKPEEIMAAKNDALKTENASLKTEKETLKAENEALKVENEKLKKNPAVPFTNGEDQSDAPQGDFNSKVVEIMKAENISKSKAISKASKLYPDLHKKMIEDANK